MFEWRVDDSPWRTYILFVERVSSAREEEMSKLENLYRQTVGGGTFESSQSSRKHYGVYTATVTDNNHDEGEYRIKVTIHGLHDEAEQSSYWARITTFMSGKDMGFYCLPEVNDEVLVAFQGGDDKLPFVIGSLWNAKETAIVKNSDQDGKNDRRCWKTRSGHFVEFNDSDDQFVSITTQAGHLFEMKDTEDLHINMITANGNNKVCISETEKTIDIVAEDTGVINITVNDGTINMDCKDLKITATNNIEMKATTNIEGKADSEVKMESGSDTTIKAGATVKVNGSPDIKLNC